MKKILEAKEISYAVEDNGVKKEILKNVSFAVEEGKNVVITGPNGSGKSTLLKIVMGLLAPTSGKIFFKGEDMTEKTVTERAKAGISFAFQTPVYFKGITVRKILDIASNRTNNLDTACKYLSKVGLCAKEYLNRDLDNKLSGGELKRIEIATALARNAELTLFDEPEAGIDLWSLNSMSELLRSGGESNIIVSHHERILSLADNIIVMGGGAIVKECTFKEFMNRAGENGLCGCDIGGKKL